MIPTRILHDAQVFARFAVVGIASNALLYLLYLVLTSPAGFRPVLAASIAWAVGVSVSFLFNRSWTFADTRPRAVTFLRYGSLYAAAYVTNIVLLVVLVDQAGLPHEPVQGVLIVLFGLGLFLGQRFWVFRREGDA